MDWRTIKSIFIIVFLLLNVFLIRLFLSKMYNEHLIVVQTETLEEQLVDDDITLPEELPEEDEFKYMITGDRRVFDDDDFAFVEGKVISYNLDRTSATVTLYMPYEIPVSNNINDLKQFMEDYVPDGKKYRFTSFEEEERRYVFYQVHDEKALYGNSNARVFIYVNEVGQIISYSQSMLVDIHEFGSAQKLIPAIKAIESLYRMVGIVSGSELTKVELGYFSLFPEIPYQVLEPSWLIEIDSKERYYVTGFEGRVFEIE